MHWNMACLQARAHQPWSHDNLFHTLLDLARVTTRAHNPQQDILAGCRQSI